MAPSVPSSPKSPRSRAHSPRTPKTQISTSSAKESSDGPSKHLPTETLTSPASIQKRNKSPGSPGKGKTEKSPAGFPQFQKLPYEVQELVWTYMLDLDAPSAHGVELRRTETSQPSLQMVEQMLWNTYKGASRAPIYPKPYALQQTCRGSKAAAERALRMWKAERPYQMNTDRAFAAPEQVDLSRDLFVIFNQLGGELSEYDQIPGARFIGVTWEGMWDNDLVDKLEEAVAIFPDVECLFVIVNAQKTTTPYLREWPSRVAYILRTYEAAYKETASVNTDGEFYCEDMVYQEVALEKLQQMPGLRGPLACINDFNKAIDSRREEASEGEHVHKPAVRVMTWSQALRVRPRFP